MHALVQRSLPALLLCLAWPLAAAAQQFERPSGPGRWFKGNTHTHTNNTDGDSPPDTVVRWYRANGYHFLVITDHDTITEPATLARHVDTSFILVRGEEVTGRYQGAPVHLTALTPGRIVKPIIDGPSLLGTLQQNIDAIRAAGGVPSINHPNYRWALDLATLRQTNAVSLFELFNGHPHVHNQGGGGSPSTEHIWDELLTGGRRIYGLAADDSHFWKRWGPGSVNPGKGWIWVRTERLTPEAIVSAIEAGQFYASTGVELEDFTVSTNTIDIRIKQERDTRYRIEFIGDSGRVLQSSEGLSARYQLQPGVGYVRARITDSGGKMAWTQPAFAQR